MGSPRLILRLYSDWAEYVQAGTSRTYHRRRADPTRLTLPWLLRLIATVSAVTWHQSIVRQLINSVSTRVPAAHHDMSIRDIERTYSRLMNDHSAALVSRALLDAGVWSTGFPGPPLVSFPHRLQRKLSEPRARATRPSSASS